VSAGRWLRAALGATLLGALLVPVPAANAGNDDEGEALLVAARTATSNETFAGVVEVRWRDDDGDLHVERVGARSLNGRFVVGVGDYQVVGRGFERVTTGAGEADAHWSAGAHHRAPRPGAAWQLDITGHHRIAGRRATEISARDAEGRVRARFYVDAAHDQLLGREVLDPDGRVARSVRFVKIVTGSLTPAVPGVPSDGSERAPRSVDDVSGGYVAPAVVGRGYRLLGRYEHDDGVVQLYYSDGLFSLSVFEQPGAVDWSALPRGESAHIGGLRARAFTTAVGTVVVWGDRDLVLTAVGDGPRDAVIGVVARLSGSPDQSDWFDDVVDFVLDPFSWF